MAHRHHFSSVPNLSLVNPAHMAFNHTLHCHNSYFDTVVRFFVDLNHISPTKYNLENRDFVFSMRPRILKIVPRSNETKSDI